MLDSLGLLIKVYRLSESSVLHIARLSYTHFAQFSISYSN